MKLPVGFQLIGNIGLEEYKEWLGRYANLNSHKREKAVVKRAYARTGIVGNPSDGAWESVRV
jgi:glucuronokinase